MECIIVLLASLSCYARAMLCGSSILIFLINCLIMTSVCGYIIIALLGLCVDGKGHSFRENQVELMISVAAQNILIPSFRHNVSCPFQHRKLTSRQ